MVYYRLFMIIHNRMHFAPRFANAQKDILLSKLNSDAMASTECVFPKPLEAVQFRAVATMANEALTGQSGAHFEHRIHAVLQAPATLSEDAIRQLITGQTCVRVHDWDGDVVQLTTQIKGLEGMEAEYARDADCFAAWQYESEHDID